MPESSEVGKAWMAQRVAELSDIKKVLDLGVGKGTYRMFFEPIITDAFWVGVEVWNDYVQRFRLRHKYDLLIVEDIRNVPPMYRMDLTIFGDVLEHLKEEEAIETYKKFAHYSKHILINIPINESKQEPVEGENPHEAHLSFWTHDKVLKNFKNIVAHWRNEEKGCYLATQLIR